MPNDLKSSPITSNAGNNKRIRNVALIKPKEIASAKLLQRLCRYDGEFAVDSFFSIAGNIQNEVDGEKSLISNPPYSVKDNLLFGLGMSHYKLGNISLVSKPLSRLIKEYPDSEKWFMSHVILALTNYRQREKSQALYILEQGLKRNPPHFILSVMQNLMDLIQEKSVDTGS